MTPADQTIRTGFGDVSKATRGRYRYAWRVWSHYCTTVGHDPCRAPTPVAQAWIESMRLQGLSTSYIARHVSSVRCCHEYLAMLGHQPFEPFRLVEVPKIVVRGARPAHDHEVLTDERVARAIYETRDRARAHGILWACAGMGLSTGELAVMSERRIRRVGDTSVAVVERGGRGHLIPIPRELLLIIDQSGWPVKAKNQASCKTLVKLALQPSISTSGRDLREFHRDCAIRLGMVPELVDGCLNDGNTLLDVRSRFSYKTHSAVIVCQRLRELMLDFAKR